MTLLIGWKVITALIATLSLRCTQANAAWCTNLSQSAVRHDTEFVFDDLVTP